MIGRLRLVVISFLAIFVATLARAPHVAAQQASSRFKVLVPDLQPQGDANDDFGKDLAKDLRGLINNMATHQPVSRDDIKDALKQFKMDMEDLNCVRTRQLAGQISAQVALCGSYQEVGNKQYKVDAQFVVVDNNETFKVDPITVGEKDDKKAAQHIIDAFDKVVQQTRATAFCQDYFSSQQWQSALQNCQKAIDLNPGSVVAHYTKALTYEKLDSLNKALPELKKVLELDPVNENALQWAGNISARLNQNEDARSYYEKYLQLNPQDANVRMRIAYDLAQAGDPVGAMQLVEEGIKLNPDNADLYEQYGNFAFSAASQAMQGQQQASNGQDQQLPPDVADHYRKAIDAYEKVFQMKGDSVNAGELRNVVAAYVQLGQQQDAIDFAQKALQKRPDEAQLWSVYADALNRAGDVEHAISALDTLESVDPDYANVAVRQGKWLMDAGRVQDAVPVLKKAVQKGEQTPDVVARLLLADAHQKGVQKDDYAYAIKGIQAAEQFDVSPKVKSELSFWHAYSLFQQAQKEQQPQTVETAKSTLPKFQQALKLFQSAKGYAAQQSSIDLQKFLDATNTFIEIQQAIIKRAS